MKSKAASICGLPLWIVLTVISASGQNITSTIVGQVNDLSGKGVADANITVTNTGTGISTSATASSTGAYSISGLQAGTYTVAADQAGFAAYKQTGVAVQSAQIVRVDISLQVGTVSQTVNVTAGAPLIHADSPSIEGTLGTQQINNLPSAYQSIAGLYVAVPGATVGGGVSNPQFAGTTHWGSANYSLNGVSLDDAVNGGGAYAYASGGPSDPIGLVNLPALDTLQEFRVVDINANAEFRDVTSVIMVTKQGANQFHGDLYEFFQNASLNANTLLLNATGQPRAQDNLNQFGGTIGGPIVRNKAFFFFAPVFLRKVTSGLAQLNLPSTAMVNGDFSALYQQHTQLYNPFTGQPFPNNQIPANMIAPQSKALLKYLPAPTVAGALGLPNSKPDYFASVPIDNSMNGYTARGDYQLTPSDSLFGVYMRSTGAPWNVFMGGPPEYGNALDYGFRDQTVSLAETHTFSATTLNDFRAAWFVHTSIRNGQNPDFDPASLFPQLTPGANRGLPTMSLSGYGSVFDDTGYAKDARTTLYDVEFTENFTKVMGNHSIKAGVDETGYKSYALSGRGSLGSFGFSGVWTGNKGWPGQPQSQGNAFADFLLGVSNSATESTVAPDSEEYNRDWEAYVQDTWQATPHLTLYYGIRYMYQTPWNVRDNARSLYDVMNNKLALPQNSATPTLPVLGNQAFFNSYSRFFETTQSIGLPTNYMRASTNYWAPRFGFAFRPTWLGNTVIRAGYGVYYNFLIEAFGARDSANIPFGQSTATATSRLPGHPTAPYKPDITFQNPFGSAASVIALNPSLIYVQPDLKNAMVQQWNFTMEHQFHQNWLARASYVGSVTRHLPWYNSDINIPFVQTPNETLQQQRIHQPWGTINSIRSGGNQAFNQLQLEAIKRYSNGMSLQAEYSWTRSLDDVESIGGPQRWYYPNLDYGNTTGIRTHTLVLNYLYALPFGHGRQWLNNSSKVVNALAGGWEVSGITTYATGTPFSVTFSVPSDDIGWLGGRADRVPGVPVYERQSGHDVIDGVQWFNPAAFGPPQPWTWGNSGRNILWGPGLWNWDISVLKQIPVAGERVRMTVRADFLDAFNHFNLGGPRATVSSTQYGGLPVPNAGMILGGSGNRNIQMGLRVTF